MSEVEPFQPEEQMGDQRQPYDRLPDEGIFQYDLFGIYLKAGQGRSIQALAEETGEGVRRLHGLAKRYSWASRVQVYDTEMHRRAVAEIENRAVEMRGRHAKIAEALMSKATAAVELQDPRFIHPKDIPIWIDTAAKLERLSRGVESSKKVVEVNGQINVNVAQELTTEQRRELLAQSYAELQRRIGAAALEEGITDAEIVEDDE